jgi:membrane protein required for colicin V production
MHWLDVLLILALVLGAVFGARTGLLRQVARIVSFSLALLACLSFRQPASALLSAFIQDDVSLIREALAGVITFVVVFGVLYGVTLVIDSRLKWSRLKIADRILGGVFGLVKMGLFAGGVLLVVAVVADADTEAALGRSTMAPVLLRGVRVALVAVPEQYKEDAIATLDRITGPREEKNSGPDEPH